MWDTSQQAVSVDFIQNAAEFVEICSFINICLKGAPWLASIPQRFRVSPASSEPQSVHSAKSAKSAKSLVWKEKKF